MASELSQLIDRQLEAASQDKVDPAARKVAALATEAAHGRPASSSPAARDTSDDESASAWCLGRRGLITSAVISSAILALLLLVSRHAAPGGGWDAAGLARARKAGPP